MTIAFAIRAYGYSNPDQGLVIAADTEETDGDTKLNQPKIFVFERTNGVCAIVGAGSGGPIDALTERLGEAYERGTESTRPELRDMFGRVVEDFHRHHLDPYIGLPNEVRPEVYLMIGVQQADDAPVLFATELSTIRTVERNHAIGIGSRTAEILLTRLYDHPMTTKKAGILAAYVAHRVKESVSGCGKLTQIVILHHPFQHPSHTGLPWHYVKELEERFDNEWFYRERQFLNDLIQEELARLTLKP